MSAEWEQRIRCRMPASRIRRAWMVWAIWGMVGTSLTMEGTVDMTALSVSALLTAPFWAAFILWPVFRLWRRLRDRDLWAEEVEPLIHDAEGEDPFGLPVIRGRSGLLLAAQAVSDAVPDAAALLASVPRRAPDEEGGLPFETYEPEALARWGSAYLEKCADENGDAVRFARWTNTFRHADRALRG